MNAVPWPTTEQEVTGVGLARHFAEQAMVAYGCKEAHEIGSRQYMHHLVRFIDASVITELFKLLSEHYPAVANHWAREVWLALETGDYYPEAVWQWLNDWNLDPTQIREDAKAAEAQFIGSSA